MFGGRGEVSFGGWGVGLGGEDLEVFVGFGVALGVREGGVKVGGGGGGGWFGLFGGDDGGGIVSL